MNEALWALGRGTGVVALIMFTITLVLGIVSRSGRPIGGLGRFGLNEVHRTAAMTGVGLIVVHVGSLFFDPYAQLKLVDLALPFLGSYRPFWLGLGTLAVDLLAVITVVSLLRNIVGPRVFKAVHWLDLRAVAGGAAARAGQRHRRRLPVDGRRRRRVLGLRRRCGRLAPAPVVRRARPGPPPESGDPMTETMTDAPSSTRRLLGPAPQLPLPHLTAAELVELVEQAGLTGRGGAGFPTARKLMSVAGHRPVVLGNAMEGEPLSSKDAVLLHQSPGLVVDGLSLLGSALGARRLVLATGPEVPSGPAEQTALGTSVEVLPLTGGFVAGQESALVNQVNGQLGVPSDPLVPVFRRGVDRRPTLVLNAETLAQLALLARYGADWFRAEGTTSDPGTFLATISGSSPTTLRHPGVLEVPRGAPLRSLLVAAGTELDRVQAVLVGGYHGAWIPGSHLETRMTSDELSRYGATPGAGVVYVLDRAECPLAVSARIATYLAGESARQCGPCVNGLPRMASTLRALAAPGARGPPGRGPRPPAGTGQRPRRVRPPGRNGALRGQHHDGLRRPRGGTPRR